MLGFGKKKPATEKPEKKGLFSRLNKGLSKTRERFSENIAETFLGKKEIDDDLLEELEMQLLTADIGVAATEHFMESLREQVRRKDINNPAVLLSALKDIMQETLAPAENPLVIDGSHHPHVIMMIGVNGAGKTTTIGKLAKRLQDEGHSIILSAGDTFRAAAVEQLQAWGERNSIPVVAQASGSDSAAVSFDALQSATSRNIDVLIADTAGRLHTQSHLMEELKKITRVMKKVDEAAPHEVMLVLDACIGQNALQQAKLFHEAIGVNSLCITKLDGTAKGGIIFSIVKELGLPIRFIGVGERIDDLQVFNAKSFVDALFT